MKRRPGVFAGALLLLLGLLSVSSARAQGTRIAGPTSVAGDGKSIARFEIVLGRRDRSKEPSHVEVSSTAGTVQHVVTANQSGNPTFEVLAPRVARDRPVVVRASLRIGGHRRALRYQFTATTPKSTLPAVSSGGSYDLRGPLRIPSHHSASVEFTIARPESGNKPEIYASVGQVTALEDTGDGRLRAKYSPPQRSYPSVAIIAVLAPDRTRYEWRQVELLGGAEVKLSSEAGASVLVRVGDSSFGPVKTDQTGRAALWLDVPPGIDAAHTEARDRVGNLQHGTLPLSPPPYQRLLAVCPRDSERLLIFAVARTGSPLSGGIISAGASRGTLSALNEIAPGVYSSAFTAAPESVIGDEIEVRAQLGSDTFAPAECRAPLGGETPRSADVQLSESVFRAGGPAAVDVYLTPRYPGHRPRLRVPIDLSVDFGQISAAIEQRDGRYWAIWKLPNDLQGRARVTLTAHVNGIAIAERDLQLKAGPVAELTLRSPHKSLLADGSSTATLDISASDEYGNAVSGAELETAAPGFESELAELGAGRYRITLLAHRRTYGALGTVRVTAIESGVSEQISLRIVPLFYPRSLSARFGYVDNLGKISGLSLNASFSHRLPFLYEHMSAGVSLGWHRSEDSRLATDAMTEVVTAVSAVPILARLGAQWAWGSLLGYGSIGAGTVFSSVAVASSVSGVVQEHGFGFALAGDLGIGFALGSGWLIVETGYLHAPVDFVIADGNTGGLKASLGYRYTF